MGKKEIYDEVVQALEHTRHALMANDRGQKKALGNHLDKAESVLLKLSKALEKEGFHE